MDGLLLFIPEHKQSIFIPKPTTCLEIWGARMEKKYKTGRLNKSDNILLKFFLVTLADVFSFH